MRRWLGSPPYRAGMGTSSTTAPTRRNRISIELSKK